MAGSNYFVNVSDTLAIALTTPDGESSSSGQLAMFAKCVGTPPTDPDLFAHGCIIVQTDSGNGNDALFQNTGDATTPAWVPFIPLPPPAASFGSFTGTYDFDVEGGAFGGYPLGDAVPLGAVVWLQGYDVEVQPTSLTNAARIHLEMGGVGVFTPSLAPNNAAFDVGSYALGTQELGLLTTSNVRKQVFSGQSLQFVIEHEDLTAGKITFFFNYFISS